MIILWLINSMTTEIVENFLPCTTAKRFGNYKRNLSPANISELFSIEKTVHKLQQGRSSITQYFKSINRQRQQGSR